MTTRIELLVEYTIDERGIIQDPGKFENEPIYAPYFHEASLDGSAEELSGMVEGSGEYATLVEISPEDRAEFPELGAALYALVTESDSGFVSVKLIESEAQADKVRAEYEPDEDVNEDEE